jgi:hypothetical protein
MKFKVILLTTLLLSPLPAFSQVNVYDECTRYIYKEEYIPGYYDNTGRYKSGTIRKHREKVPCTSSGGYHQQQFHRSSQQTRQGVGCNRGSRVMSGLLGGGLAALVSKKDAYIWSIPVGVIGGVAVDRAGCS